MPAVRGQGFQHAIQDCVNYVEMLAKIEADPSTISAAMAAFDGEIVERGAAAVLQANAEAEKALNPASVAAMQMARQGHVRTA